MSTDLPLIPILSGYHDFSQKSRRHPDFPDLIPHIPILGVRNCQRQGQGIYGLLRYLSDICGNLG